MLWETDSVVKAALDHLVEELWDRREDVQNMLQRLDRNGTGSISRQEMQRGLTGMGIRLTPSEISAVMRAFDVNNDGTVAWHEFYRVLDTWERSGGGAAAAPYGGRGAVAGSGGASGNWAVDHLVEELYDRREDVFHRLHMMSGESGVLPRGDMQRGLVGMGLRLKSDEFEAVMDFFDRHDDGMIILNDFCDYINSCSPDGDLFGPSLDPSLIYKSTYGASFAADTERSYGTDANHSRFAQLRVQSPRAAGAPSTGAAGMPTLVSQPGRIRSAPQNTRIRFM